MKARHAWFVAFVLGATAACTADDVQDSTSAVDTTVGAAGTVAEDRATAAPTSASTTTAGPVEATSTTAVTSTTVAPTTVSPTTTAAAAASAPDPGCPSPPPATPAEGESSSLEQVGTFDGGTVYAAAYRVPDDLGEPWSQWGEGVVLPDGRFVSGVGDHRGVDGRSWFYEYDPTERRLIRTAEVSAALGHAPGEWGYGKLHAPMVLDACDRVVTATYWGTRRNIEFGGSYSGDHLIRYDPGSREVTSLGVPVPGYGLPSLSLSPDRATLFVEAVDPASDPNAGVFLVVDATTGEVRHTDRSTAHIGFRDVLVTPDGAGLYASGNGLAGLTAAGETIGEPGVFPGDSWFRSATPPADDGSVAISTREPDALWLRDAEGRYRELGALDAYVASLALTDDGSTAYFVPGAHGNGFEQGTPLITADTATGTQKVVVRLNDLIEPALGIRVGGTYNVVVDDEHDRIYVGLNGGAPDAEEVFGEVVLAVVEFD